MARLSPTIVKQVTDVLRSQNKKVTNRNIVNCLGYGSFSTLKKIRKGYPEFFSSGDTSSKGDTRQIDFTFKDDFTLEKRVSSLEVSIQLMQQSIQQLIHDRTVSLVLEKQVKELAENLEGMYQLWRELAEKTMSQPVEKVVTIVSIKQSTENEKPLCDIEIPDPKEGAVFLVWAEQQKHLNNGAWKPVVEQLNQQQVFMPKGGVWTTKSLSDFVRKKRQQFLKRG